MFREISNQICSFFIGEQSRNLALKWGSLGDRYHHRKRYANGVVVKGAFLNVTPR
jgi:hypothetical protein